MRWTAAAAALAMTFSFVLPAQAQTIQVELIIEAFDGSGCIPSNPPICPEPADLDGAGCNAHDGSTNNPDATCGQAGLTWPSNYPNPSFWGAQKVDENWSNNLSFPVDWLGSNAIKNGVEPENQGSQGATIRAGQNTLTKPESANLGYITPDPQEKVAGFGRMYFESIRQEYNANNPDDLKPAPIPGTPVKVLYDVLRNGDGSTNPDPDPQNPALKMRADLIAVDHEPVPSSAVWTWRPNETRMIPADGQWHTYEIGEWAEMPEKAYMGIGIQLTADSYTLVIPDGQVSFYIDNVRIIYEALPPDEVCDNGLDDDGDGLTDCDDPDCDEDPACPCNRILFADVDRDLDVDQKDFASFQLCYTGPGFGGTLTPQCACFDAAGTTPGQPDGSIDQLDFNAFLACSSGPDILADPACDD